MRKLMIRVLICLLISGSVWGYTVVCDRQALNEELIRLHIVANSDSREDQAIKLQVRDAVLRSLRQGMEEAADAESARVYIRENLPKLQKAANDTLEALGCDREAVASFCREVFDVRHYETFSLPSGIYDSLRITIGQGQGHNWWCVAYPQLCLPATAEEFRDAAAGAGFSGGLQTCLTEDYSLRFWILDLLGKAQRRNEE